ncbi:MAG: glycosyltransferase family 2 protein [candidate division WS1 bacterium]|nr:glycosyltransferase family 2 protein [candidate division WS1 bacterium]
MKTDLSLCIVSYNCKELLVECLRSIFEHVAGLEVEVIVADNASSDGTVEMLRADFPRVRLLAFEDNRGFAAGTNAAMAAAGGEVLMMLNPDTTLREGAVQQLVAFLGERPEAGAVGPAIFDPEGGLQMTCHLFPTLWQTLIRQLGLHRAFPASRTFGAYDMTWWDHSQPRRVDWLSGACIAVRRDVWERVGGLDEGFFMYAEDVDWCYRLAQAEFERWYLPGAEIVHHEAGSWADASRERIIASHRSMFRYFGKNYGHLQEVAVRLLVAWGALIRGSFWTIMGPVLGEREAFVSSYETHFRVAERAAAMEETWRERRRGGLS